MGSHFSLKSGINYKNGALWLIIFKVTGRPILPVPQQRDLVPRMGLLKQHSNVRFNSSTALDFLTYFFEQTICPSL